MDFKEIFCYPNEPSILCRQYSLDPSQHSFIKQKYPFLGYFTQPVGYGFYVDPNKNALDKVALEVKTLRVNFNIPNKPFADMSSDEIENVMDQVYEYCVSNKIFYFYCLQQMELKAIAPPHDIVRVNNLRCIPPDSFVEYDWWLVDCTKNPEGSETIWTVGNHFDKINREKAKLWQEMKQ